MVDKPVRVCSTFYGENRRRATVYQDLKTREYIVERTHEGLLFGFNNHYEKLEDAENSAEDWVMPQ